MSNHINYSEDVAQGTSLAIQTKNGQDCLGKAHCEIRHSCPLTPGNPLPRHGDLTVIF